MTCSLQNLVPNKHPSQIGLHRHLNIPEDLIEHINESDDWTATILISGVLEAHLSEVICSGFAKDSLRTIQNLPLHGRTGKTSLLEELGFISRDEKKFLSKFSNIRNSIAHGTSKFDFSYDAHFQDKHTKDEFLRVLPIDAAYDHSTDKEIPFDSDPRSVIFFNILNVCFGAMTMAVFDEGDLCPYD